MIIGKTYWLVGASEGLGRALAKELHHCGAHLILSARSEDRLQELAANLNNRPRILSLDVTEPASIDRAISELGEIDGVIYIAALYEPMRVQNWDIKSAEAIADVNFMGAIRTLGRITSALVERDQGHIVIIGSLSGYRGLPAALTYGASKAGLMHLAEAMRADLWKTGVKVQLFNLGFIKTRLTDKNQFRMPFLMTPEKAARHIVSGMKKPGFKFDTPWMFSIVFRLSRILPQFLYERLFAR